MEGLVTGDEAVKEAALKVLGYHGGCAQLSARAFECACIDVWQEAEGGDGSDIQPVSALLSA